MYGKNLVYCSTHDKKSKKKLYSWGIVLVTIPFFSELLTVQWHFSKSSSFQMKTHVGSCLCKWDLINSPRRVYSHEVRQWFLTQTQGADKLKTGRQQGKNLILAACLIKEKHWRKVLFLLFKVPLLKHAHSSCIKPP